MSLRSFDVSCYHKISGRLAWSMTQQAYTAAQAIAQACLPPEDRQAFVTLSFDANPDETSADHPAYLMADAFAVAAEVIR